MVNNWQWFIDGYIQTAIGYGAISVMVIAFMMTTKNGRGSLKKFCKLVRNNKAFSIFAVVAIYVLGVFAGVKPPPVIVEEGIKIISCDQCPEYISFSWTTTDEEIHVGTDYFLIQEYLGGQWVTIGRTRSTSFRLNEFTVNRTSRYRIAVDVTPESEEIQ